MGWKKALAIWTVLMLPMAGLHSAYATPEKAWAIRMKGAIALQPNQACVRRVESKRSFQNYAREKGEKSESAQHVPTDEEIGVLAELYSADLACDKLAIEGVAKVSPAFVTWIAMISVRRDQRRLKLMSKSMSWVAYDLGRWDDVLEDSKQIDAIQAQMAEIVDKLLEWQAYEIEQQHLAARWLQTWSALQQQIQALSPSGRSMTIVNCTYEGLKLRC